MQKANRGVTLLKAQQLAAVDGDRRGEAPVLVRCRLKGGRMQALRVAMALGFGLFAVGVGASGQDSDRNVSRESIGLQTTRDGYLPGPGVDSEPRPGASSATACFQLHNGGITWFINAVLDIDSYPYTITGGNIAGTICDSPNWLLTGGLVGPNLTINVKHTPPGAGCFDGVTIVGRFGPPAGYAGIYKFDGFERHIEHRILFLGFRPCPEIDSQ